MEIKAKSWCWQKKGEPTDLILKEKAIREIGDNEVLIQNRVIGLNPVDWKLIEWGHPEWKPDSVPGVDGMGIILKVGRNMNHLRIGSRVCYHTDLSKDGSFSPHTIVSGHALMYVPDKLSDTAAASFPCPSLTAWQAFQKIPNIAGKKVLVSGAGGSVGYFLTQLLLEANARVYVTASKKHHAEFLKMGVIQAVDYKDNKWKEAIKNRLNGNSFDAIIDTVSGEHATGMASLLGYYGHLVAIQDRVGQSPLPAFTTCISLHEVALGAFHKYGSPQQITELMQQGELLLHKIASGTLRIRDNKVETFDNLAKHLAEMKANNIQTKYLIKVS